LAQPARHREQAGKNLPSGNQHSASLHKPEKIYPPAIQHSASLQRPAFDVVIIPRKAVDDLVRQGRILPDTCVDIGRSGLGISVRKGAPKPDISTVESFKRTMLGAKSVIRSTEGTSGLYFETLLDRLGITGEMKDKIRLGPSGRVLNLSPRVKLKLRSNRSVNFYR
jgi:hypothetical protein